MKTKLLTVSSTWFALALLWQPGPALAQGAALVDLQDAADGVNAALAEVNKPRSVISYTVSTGGGESVPPVVVQFSTNALSSTALMVEDLTIMNRLIEKALEGGLGEEDVPVKSGIKMLLTGGGRSVRAMYVEGLGPLFMIKVNFPLLPPPKVEPKPEPAAASSEWERARKEVVGTAGDEDNPWRNLTTGGPQFNPEQVDALKNALLTVLKEAANIRQLKPTDFVGLSVFGTDSRGGVAGFGGGFGGGGGASISNRRVLIRRSTGATASQNSAVAATPAPPSSARAPGAPPESPAAHDARAAVTAARAKDLDALMAARNARDSGQGSVLTLRARKSDIDAFAKGNLDLNAFRNATSIHAYPGTGQSVTSVNSWIQQRPR